MSAKSEKFIANLNKFIDYYISAKGVKPESIRVKKKDRNLLWLLMSGTKYRNVEIDFIKDN